MALWSTLLPLLLAALLGLARGDNAVGSACASPAGPANSSGSTGTRCELQYLGECLNRTLSGPVTLLGTTIQSTWEMPGAFIEVTPDALVTASCFIYDDVVSGSLGPPALSTLLDPPFIQTTTGEPPRLVMRDLEFHISCDALLQWQDFLCGARLPGPTTVSGSSAVFEQWSYNGAVLESVTLSCDPGDAVFVPACDLRTVKDASSILRAVQSLQDPDLPLVLALADDLDFGSSDWPDDGVRITANVTLSALLGSNVVISFGLKTVLFQVDSRTSSTAFMALRGCVLLDLPLSYLPLDHPRRAFGILSTGLWPVYREQVAMGLYNCTLVLTKDEFTFWSFWLSILISPIPAVRDLADWSHAAGVQLDPSGTDYIQLASYYGRYTTLVNVRYEISGDDLQTAQRNNILQITGNAQVPPTVVFQVRDSDDLFTAMTESSPASAKQYGQYIILVENITMANATTWPSAGVPVRYPTVITTWPSAYALFDTYGAIDSFSALASVAIKNTVLLNLAYGPDGAEFNSMVSGLWMFNRLSLVNVALVVPQQEVDVYWAATLGQVGPNPWISAYKINTYDNSKRTWIYFSSLSTLRFTAQNVNITSAVPKAFDMIPITLPSGGSAPPLPNAPSGGTDRREVLLFALLAITLPTALGAAIVTYLVVRRRRLSAMCSRASAQADGKDLDDEADWETNLGAEEGGRRGRRQEPTCCLYLPLRRSKYVNPLYADPGEASPAVVLTGVLGPTARARAALQDAAASGLLPRASAAAVGSSAVVLGMETPAALLSTESASVTDMSTAALSPFMGQGYGSVDGGARMPSTEGVALVAEEQDTRAAAETGHTAHASTAAAEASLPQSEQEDGGGLASTSPGRERQAREPPGQERRSHALSSMSPSSSGLKLAVAACAAAAGASFGRSATNSAARSPAAGSSVSGGLQGSDAAEARTRLRRIEDALGCALASSTASPSAAAATAMASQLLLSATPSEEQQHVAIERRLSRLNASTLPASASPGAAGSGSQQPSGALQDQRLLEMQRLDRVQREIGDRHLEVHHSLGWGGCGVVYRGTWKGLPVAVKTVLVQGDSPQSRQFLLEAAISASLQHANIVTTYLYELRPLDEVDGGLGNLDLRLRAPDSADDATTNSSISAAIASGAGGMASGGLGGVRGGRMSCWKLYIVQEFCELGTLKAAVDQGYFKGTRGGLPNMPFLLTIALDVAVGLQHVHSKGVVHGDVTASNVLLQALPSRPQGCVAKVADFGLSVRLEPGQSQIQNLYGGTPHYMAPERSRGCLSKRSDIYSLGVCLHEIFPRNCPSEYAALVVSCLEADPSMRPGASEVVEALQRMIRRYGACGDAALWVSGIRRLPGTHPLPPDLGRRFPKLIRLDLSGDSALLGGLSLFRALQSVGGTLLSLDLGGCSGLPASFVARQLPEACPKLQHLALSCCCSASPEAEADVFRALAEAPHLPSTLTSLELRCGPAFQPELSHLAGLPSIRRLRIHGCRTIDDEAARQLPRLLPGLRELHIGEQASRRGRHIKGDGLAALASCSELRSLSLSCTEPEPRRLAAALAALTQLTDLDLSGCDPVILDSIGMLHPLAAAGAYGGSGGGALAALALPAAYTCDQLVRGLPQLLTASAAATAAAFALTGAGAAGTTHDAGLRRLRLQASTALPVQVAAPLLALAGLHELRLSHCGLPPALPPPALAAAAAALSSLTSLQLMQEGGSDEGGMMLADEGNDAAAEGGVRHAQPVEGASRSGWSWYELVPSWGSLQRLEITGASSLTDEHLFEMGCSLPCLTHFALSRSGGVSGAGGRGFASWPSGCRRLSSVSLYDCAGIGDEALGHIAVLPSLTCLALAHLPYVGPHGVRQLAAGATRLAVLTVERLAGAPAPALAALWRLPALESLSLRMCEGTLVTTSGLRALGRAAGLTHLNLSHCLDVNDGIPLTELLPSPMGSRDCARQELGLSPGPTCYVAFAVRRIPETPALVSQGHSMWRKNYLDSGMASTYVTYML
eukprot:XP_001691957.1 predicted protein [Chlamydomonas reinhardtii]